MITKYKRCFETPENVPPTGERVAVTDDESLPCFCDVEASHTNASSLNDCRIQSPDQINFNAGGGDNPVSSANAETFAVEQKACPRLRELFRLADRGKGGILVEDGLLYNRDSICGHKVKQLVLPQSRYQVVLEMAHDASIVWHMASKATKNRIRLHFNMPDIGKLMDKYCELCYVYQRFAPIKVADYSCY
jgi:hypothetical protein